MSIRLSPKQQKIYDRMMHEGMGKKWTIEQISRVLYGPHPRPINWKQSVATQMRTLALKTAVRHVQVARTSKLGRGNVAEYQLELRNGRRKKAFSFPSETRQATRRQEAGIALQRSATCKRTSR